MLSKIQKYLTEIMAYLPESKRNNWIQKNSDNKKEYIYRVSKAWSLGLPWEAVQIPERVRPELEWLSELGTEAQS